MHLPARCALRIALAVSFLFLFAIQISFKTEAQEQQSKNKPEAHRRNPSKDGRRRRIRTQQKMGSELDGPVIVNTDLITLTVTVTDTYGRYVSGLSKKAFTILDEKQPQEITFFSDDDSPVSVGVIFDVSGSMSGEKIKNAREALSGSFDQSQFRRVFPNALTPRLITAGQDSRWKCGSG